MQWCNTVSRLFWSFESGCLLWRFQKIFWLKNGKMNTRYVGVQYIEIYFSVKIYMSYHWIKFRRNSRKLRLSCSTICFVSTIRAIFITIANPSVINAPILWWTARELRLVITRIWFAIYFISSIATIWIAVTFPCWWYTWNTAALAVELIGWKRDMNNNN